MPPERPKKRPGGSELSARRGDRETPGTWLMDIVTDLQTFQTNILKAFVEFMWTLIFSAYRCFPELEP